MKIISIFENEPNLYMSGVNHTDNAKKKFVGFSFLTLVFPNKLTMFMMLVYLYIFEVLHKIRKTFRHIN